MIGIREYMNKLYVQPAQPQEIIVSGTYAGMLKAAIIFHGRDPRRVKREMNKAYRQAHRRSSSS